MAPVRLKQVPLGQAPFLHPLRSSVVIFAMIEGALFDGFSSTIGLSDFSEVYTPGFRPWPSPAGLPSGLLNSPFRDLPIHTHKTYAHATGLWLRGAGQALAQSHQPMLPSPRHHWSSRHSSGPEWVATPSP